MDNLVTATMVTGHRAERRSLAMQAINCFLEQSYEHRELLIVNTGAPFAISDRRVREVLVADGEVPLGSLRNIALDEACGEYLIQWDDDDWHHPERIESQMKLASHDAATFLGMQYRCSLVSKRAVIVDVPSGIEGTILHHHETTARYPAWRKAEDTSFYQQFSERRVVLGRPELYVRLYHGWNTWSEDHIMNSRPTRELSEESFRFLRDEVLVSYPAVEI